MHGIRSFLGGLSFGFVACVAHAQAPLKPTILLDGHVAVDTTLSIAVTKLVHTALTDLLRGTGVGLATLWTPSVDTPALLVDADHDDVLAAARARHADIAIEINALQSQDGNIFLAPAIMLRHASPVDMASISGHSIDAIAKTIATRIAKDSTRLRRLAEEDRRGDSTGTTRQPH